MLPEMETTGRIVRRSTSTGIIRTDTGEALLGSNGLHIYLHAQDGADIERFLKTLHERCWLAGYGWHMVGASGQLLDRSIVDRMVYAPERLVFEGAPILVPPLTQDQEVRRPIVFDHAPLDTKTTCPPLRIVEQALLKELKPSPPIRSPQTEPKRATISLNATPNAWPSAPASADRKSAVSSSDSATASSCRILSFLGTMKSSPTARSATC